MHRRHVDTSRLICAHFYRAFNHSFVRSVHSALLFFIKVLILLFVNVSINSPPSEKKCEYNFMYICFKPIENTLRNEIHRVIWCHLNKFTDAPLWFYNIVQSFLFLLWLVQYKNKEKNCFSNNAEDFIDKVYINLTKVYSRKVI